jgi:uncharacterized protein (DUF305 family)
MSGKIRILNANGTPYTPSANPTELALYSPVSRSMVDERCGTTGADAYYDGGSSQCSHRFLNGAMDSVYERCLQAVDCQMSSQMSVVSHDSYGTDHIATFAHQMIPHHANAVNMAKLLLQTDPAGVAGVEDLEGILYNIINVQNFQIHQFRNYITSARLSLPTACASTSGSTTVPSTTYAPTVGASVAGCTNSANNFCMTLDMFASETGYYKIAGYNGPSPELTVRIGQTYTFDQTDASNWYHPVGFAYQPDGAHGSTWGGAELPEVEGAGELQYKINGANPTCADAGDTGLDCYEPEFFYPRGEWRTKQYKAELTITPAVAAASHGGVIYYFCHIHSRMSGKIRILNANGTPYTPSANPTELALYPTITPTPTQNTCGTTNMNTSCSTRYVCGNLDSTFEQCLNAVDCEQFKNMKSQTDPHTSALRIFAAQMIPHHLNAIAMTKVLLRTDLAAVQGVEDFEDILHSIINEQNFQVHQFRNLLESNAGLGLGGSTIPVETPELCAWWCTTFTCGAASCSSCGAPMCDQHASAQCDSWCNRYTCNFHQDRCSGCPECQIQASGAHCAQWCNRFTCGSSFGVDWTPMCGGCASCA